MTRRFGRMSALFLIVVVLMSGMGISGAAQDQPVDEFNIDVQGLSITCDTTVSFDAVLTHTGDYTLESAEVVVYLFDDRAAWESGTGAMVIVGGANGAITLSPGSNPWSQQVWDTSVYMADSWYVRVDAILQGYTPDLSDRVHILDSWSASVSGCTGDTPNPNEELVQIIIRIILDILARLGAS